MLPEFPPHAIAKFRTDLSRGHLARCYALPSHRRPVRLRWLHWALMPVALVVLAAEAVFEACGL